jgi:putative ABC transport system substrate-binding protein
MQRRVAIVFLGAVGLWPLTVSAQQPARVKRVAIIHPSIKPVDMRIGGDPTFATLFEEIKRLGYVEGVNLAVERYSPEGQFERFPRIAREVVATRPDVILTMAATSSVAVLQSETRTIPIVAWTGDPVVGGIVSSLARPGGNVTGVSIDAGAEYGGKRLQLLAEAAGRLSNVRLLAPPVQTPLARTTREAAEKMNITFRHEVLQTPIDETEYRRAFDEMKRDRVDGIVIGSDPENYTNRLLLGRLTREYLLPAICSFNDSVEAGALMSYAFDLNTGARRLAAQIVEILNGGNPAEMPFFQETHWELVINLKAAKELGLEIPPGLVARADRVIE